jgi:hypothetical protein
VPSDVDSLETLSADEQEIGCGVGNPNKGCGVWLFRARDGRVNWVLAFISSPGAITFQQMRALIRSVDRAIAANADA